ncbi:phage baseplate assembly protein V [Pseudoalteromonas luteoviolacea]|uniref:phage baseplate assembly protein V n=1 Tax=Pseudoalteromonas luteoviolacea TaxID=43657 RepID=UPI001F3157DE|nr:phage baseplate assembly protein V [Pseudoalteromonas luteoviolacea]MCF6440719.1 phage baseplate assembly protein V [Pseudoalteromonas luteoviolacea]
MDIRYTILVDGSEKKLEVGVREVITHRGLNQISELSILFEDGDMADESFKLDLNKDFQPGKSIEVKAGFGEDAQITLFVGVITGGKVGYCSEPYLQVLAKGEANKLCQSKISKLYKPDSTDTDIINDLLKPCGGKKTVADSKIKHYQYLMVEKKPWEVIMNRILTNGFALYEEEGINIVDLTTHTPSATEFNVAMDGCTGFELCMDNSSYAQKVDHSAWDIKTQAMLLENYDSGEKKEGATADIVIKSQAPIDKVELAAKAKAEQVYRLLDTSQGRIQVDMSEATALHKLKLLDAIKVSGAGENNKADYMVTEIHHHLSNQGWFCEFTLGLSLTKSGWSKWAELSATPMLVATVAPFKDDKEKLHRIPITLNTLTTEPIWARLLTTYVGKEEGLFLPPNPDTEVLVDFIGGDARHPVIVGACHNPVAIPPLGGYKKEYDVRGLLFKEQATALKFTFKKPHIIMEGSKDHSISLGESSGYALSQKDKAGMTAKTDVVIKTPDDSQIKMDSKITIESAKVEVATDKMEIG